MGKLVWPGRIKVRASLSTGPTGQLVLSGPRDFAALLARRCRRSRSSSTLSTCRTSGARTGGSFWMLSASGSWLRNRRRSSHWHLARLVCQQCTYALEFPSSMFQFHVPSLPVGLSFICCLAFCLGIICGSVSQSDARPGRSASIQLRTRESRLTYCMSLRRVAR